MNTATLEAPLPRPAAEARFRALLEQYSAPIARLAAAYEPNRANREDLVQDVWLALWRALPAFRGECSERTFIYRIAHNRAIAHASRRRSVVADLEEAADLPHPSPTSEELLGMAQERARLLAAIQQLPILQREVVTLSLEDLSHSEIADVLGISENNVAVRLTRARAELIQRMGARR
jgi:RNA polymerase sigma-70 factor (ECF subfamily)